MPVEWQGDHKLVGEEKEVFERELRKMGFDPSHFLVQVRQESTEEGPIRYTVYINDLKHPDRETWKLQGGHGENWIAQFIQSAKNRCG